MYMCVYWWREEKESGVAKVRGYHYSSLPLLVNIFLILSTVFLFVLRVTRLTV